MFGRNYHLLAIVLLSTLSCPNISCKDNTSSARKELANSDSANEKNIRPVFHKPISTFRDTLTIHGKAAVFYSPDSLQLEKIKQQTNTAAFNGSMHEYFYMMRNAKMVIKKTRPAVKIIEAQHCRYLLFVKKDGSPEYIDLDKYSDVYGLFLFDGNDPPSLVDMMNIETQLPLYLKP